MRFVCLISALLILGTTHAADTTSFKWDLSYQRALRDHPIGKDEFLHIWTKQQTVNSRVIQQYLADYNGPAIESALLIEHPDSDAGDPVATLFYTTSKTASSCRLHHTKEIAKSCGDLDKAKALSFMTAMQKLEPIAPTKTNNNVITTEDGRSFTMGYYGFLSIFLNGRSLQRPILGLEMNQPHLNIKKIKHWGRIMQVMTQHLLTDQQRAELQKRIEQSESRSTELAKPAAKPTK